MNRRAYLFWSELAIVAGLTAAGVTVGLILGYFLGSAG